jgi:hypothetical protein
MRLGDVLLTLALIAGNSLAASSAGALTLRVVDQELEIGANEQLQVLVMVEDAAAVAGLEFSLVYPGDVLAVVDPTTHTAGDFLSAPVVNHHADPAGLSPGMRRINVALAAAEASGVAAGTVITISFPLRCSEFSGGWPDGRDVAIQILDTVAWGIGAGGLPETVAITPVDGSALINCTTVPVERMGLSMLKAQFSPKGEGR